MLVSKMKMSTEMPRLNFHMLTIKKTKEIQRFILPMCSNITVHMYYSIIGLF